MTREEDLRALLQAYRTEWRKEREAMRRCNAALRAEVEALRAEIRRMRGVGS